jgi:hypothetical protein
MAAITASGGEGGTCQVLVEQDGREFRYTVQVPEELTERLGTEPPAIARATLAFLLDREPPTSIMREFECTVVRQYFPEYDRELPNYLLGPGSS